MDALNDREGYRIEFSPTSWISAGWKPTEIPSYLEQRQTLGEEISSLLQKGAIRRAPPAPPRLVLSSFFPTPKKNGKWRPIPDLKPLNKGSIRLKPFRWGTPRSIRPLLRQGMLATSVDLADADLHTHPPAGPSISSFLLPRGRLLFHLPTCRADHRPEGLHQSNDVCPGPPPSQGPPGVCLHG